MNFGDDSVRITEKQPCGQNCRRAVLGTQETASWWWPPGVVAAGGVLRILKRQVLPADISDQLQNLDFIPIALLGENLHLFPHLGAADRLIIPARPAAHMHRVRCHPSDGRQGFVPRRGGRARGGGGCGSRGGRRAGSLRGLRGRVGNGVLFTEIASRQTTREQQGVPPAASRFSNR